MKKVFVLVTAHVTDETDMSDVVEKCGDCYALVLKDDLAYHMEWHADLREKFNEKIDRKD